MVLEFGEIEYHLELEFKKLKLLEVLPPWHYWDGNLAIKKNNGVLKLGILEYHTTQYSSLPSSSTTLFFLIGQNF